MNVFAKIVNGFIFLALTAIVSFPFLAIVFLFDKLENLGVLLLIFFISIIIASTISELYTASHPIKILIQDEVVTICSIFRKFNLKMDEIHFLKPITNPRSYTGGVLYNMEADINGKKRRFIFHNRGIRNFNEVVDIISSKINDKC